MIIIPWVFPQCSPHPGEKIANKTRGGSRWRVLGVCIPPKMTCGFLIQLVFCKKKKTIWFIGVEVEQETSAPLPKKILDPPLKTHQIPRLACICSQGHPARMAADWCVIEIDPYTCPHYTDVYKTSLICRAMSLLFLTYQFHGDNIVKS